MTTMYDVKYEDYGKYGYHAYVNGRWIMSGPDYYMTEIDAEELISICNEEFKGNAKLYVIDDHLDHVRDDYNQYLLDKRTRHDYKCEESDNIVLLNRRLRVLSIVMPKISKCIDDSLSSLEL